MSKIIIFFLLLPFFLYSQSSTTLSFENDCMTFYIRIDSSHFNLYTTGDGGKSGPILETGYVDWENGIVKKKKDSLFFYTKSQDEFNSLIELKLKKVDKPLLEKYYFEEKRKRNDSKDIQIVFWEVISVENEEFYKKIIQGTICDK